MRVFQLNTFCGVKSTGRIALEIAKLVENEGGECKIGYGAGSVPAQAARFAYRVGNPLERKLYSQARKLFDAEGYGSLGGTRGLIREMEAFQPDLIQLHNLHGCYLNLKALFNYLRERRYPVVWTLHDCWPFTGHCAYFDYAGCQRWQTGCEHCPQQRGYPVCFGLDGSKRNYEHKKALFTSLDRLTFVTPCQWMQTPLSRSFLGAYPVRTIYNGVDLNAFMPVESDLRARYGLREQKLALAVASDWDERKGLKYLVQAAEKLGESCRVAVVGLSPAQRKALPPGMLGVEPTASARELAAWYTAADCLVNPTMEDNMPMVNLEALACGTPVAVFRTGGCPEAVDDRCGRVVDKGDVDGLCEAVRQLCRSKATMRDACLQKAQTFDSRRTFERYLALYKDLCP